MKSGFVKKTAKKEQPQLYSKNSGVFMGSTGHYFISSGCFSLDNYITGFPISSLILICEDINSEDYQTILRLNLGEAIENNQQCVIFDNQDWTPLIPPSTKFSSENIEKNPNKEDGIFLYNFLYQKKNQN